ncbi:MAG TPA: hypothetical protein VMV61_08935 [Patescibacteria group bacterium]|nr:hypothetical protein [Patescibacteria group bacterium]
MSERTKLGILIVLGVILAAVLFYAVRGASPAAVVAAGKSAEYKPLAIVNPALHLDRIERLRKLDYRPTGRDILSSSLPPPPAPKKEVRRDVGPMPPPPPPPLVVPFKFYGYTADAASKRRRAFFTNGEDVFIAAEGETVQGKFRVLTIGNTWAEVEEISSNRRAKLNMEGPPSGAPGESPQL